jgi:hypothetical protein
MLKNYRYLIIIISILLQVTSVYGQYAPAAGITGSTAIHKDSTIFIAWGSVCETNRGWINCMDTTLGKVDFGSNENAAGKADGSVVSLGDNGSATLQFTIPVKNGESWDFAVFENSFSDDFLELSYVEVSSDGLKFVKFPCVSLTQTDNQIESFGLLDATKIDNLAGKYRGSYGVPFDLEVLKDSINVNINNITHIRIIDVGGSINPLYASYDSNGNIINDPFPTPFSSGGFDLDAVGIIHNTNSSGISSEEIYKPNVYPNPFNEHISIDVKTESIERVVICDMLMNEVYVSKSLPKHDLSHLLAGSYIIVIYTREQSYTSLIIKL